MDDGTGSWAEHRKRRGLRVGWFLLLAGVCSLVVIVRALAAGGTPSPWRLLLGLALLVPLQLLLVGTRRIAVESSPSLRPPLVLPAVVDPGRFARYPRPRPAFGLRAAPLRPARAVLLTGLILGPPVLGLALVARAPIAALMLVGVVAAMELPGIAQLLWAVPVEVRVAGGTFEWRARLRSGDVPVGALRRIRSNTWPRNAVVLESEGHAERMVLVTGGFADFLEALTVTCPWIEVDADVVTSFGSWRGRTNGYFVEETSEHAGR